MRRQSPAASGQSPVGTSHLADGDGDKDGDEDEDEDEDEDGGFN